MPTARVTSIDALKEFKLALASFGEDADAALCSIELEINRFVDWLHYDQMSYWNREVRKRTDKVAEARSDLHKKKLTAMFGNNPSIVDEQVALKRAKVRLEEAEEKVKTVRKWLGIVQHAVNEYEGQAQQLGNVIADDIPRGVAVLGRMIEALEKYTQIAPPSHDLAAPSDAGESARNAAAVSFAQPAGKAATDGDGEPDDKQSAEEAQQPQTIDDLVANAPVVEPPKTTDSEATDSSADQGDERAMDDQVANQPASARRSDA